MKTILTSFVSLAFVTSAAAYAQTAQPYNMSYAGRLVDDQGKPIQGPVKLELKFYDSKTASTAIAITTPQAFNDVELAAVPTMPPPGRTSVLGSARKCRLTMRVWPASPV